MTPAARSKKWWHWLLMPLAPLLLPMYPLLVVIFIALAGLVTLFVRVVITPVCSMRFHRTMRSAGRTATWSEVEGGLADRPSSLIVEHVSVGWLDVNIWWVEGSIGAFAKEAGVTARAFGAMQESDDDVEGRMLNPVYERWCLARFIDRSTGCARLVQSTHSSRGWRETRARLERLRSGHPTPEIVEAETWMARMADDAAKRAAGKRPRLTPEDAH